MAESSSSANQQFQILTASLEDAQIPLFLRNRLHQFLPHSLPLYRRCQFHLDQRTRQKTDDNLESKQKPEIWLALSRDKNDSNSVSASGDWLQPWLAKFAPGQPSESSDHPVYHKSNEQSQWIAAHIDLTEPGQTQVWIFGSWESTFTQNPSNPSSSVSILAKTSPGTISQRYTLFQAFYRHLRANHIPFLSLTPSPQWIGLKESGKIVSVPYNRNKVLFGTISEAMWWMHEDWVVHDLGIPPHILLSNRNLNQEAAASSDSSNAPRSIAREDRPYLKYLLPLPPPSSFSDPPPAPQGFRFLPLQPHHLQTMLDRSPIPRSLELLHTLISVGIFPTDSSDPVAWGILSKDASIGSLHTEPEFRGRGFAEAVSRALMALTPTRFGGAAREDGGVVYGHTDVSPANVASRRVFEKMGAKVGWRVGWVEVNVGLKEKEK